EIDFTRDKMVWTELDYNPVLPAGMSGKGGGGAGGLEAFGAIMKAIGEFLGRRPAPEVTMRGFYGMILTDGDENPVVQSVLDKGPAGSAGLQPKDVITHIQDRSVSSVADVLVRARRVARGNSVRVTVKRGSETIQLTI